MASDPNRHMFFFISHIICVVTATIFVVVTNPFSLYSSVLNYCLWLLLLLFLLLLNLAFFLRERRSSSSSSLTSSVVPERKYEVFLSFRGIDIRKGFLSHLCRALDQKKIHCFVDDQNLQQGNEISAALLAAIDQSEISLLIFSENYASSTWRLEELAHIIECMENHNRTVIPVFYEIDPTSVRYQKGGYKDAFARHEKRFDKHKLQKWRDVLKKAADLSGFHSVNYKIEADLITEVVHCMLKKLNMTSHHDDLKGLVGIQERITHLETRLRKKSQNAFIIGIWGPGGIGKTTIAEVLFKRLYNEYEGGCFLRIREGFANHGTMQLKERLLSKLLGEDPDIILNNGILPDYERRLRRKKVLVLLDDINKLEQREMLVGRCEWFGPDSRIIVTSRDKNLINFCHFIYEVKQLNFEEALQLFNLNALPEICLDKEHELYKLSKQVIKYTEGNPLAIKVVGSSLRGGNKSEWKSKLKKLDKNLDRNIQDVLRLSYDDLDDEEKDVFLYLACFFRRDSKERIISLLHYDYHIIDGLRVLQNRALITIDDDGDWVSMHDLIQNMGCEIVKKKNPKNPSQRNHLWDADDIHEVFKKNKGTEEIESIRLDMGRLKKDLHLRPLAFARMDNLKLLRIYEDNALACTLEPRVHVPEEDMILSDKLRSLHWDCYPSKSFRLRFCLDNLVELRMEYSRLQKLWDGIQELPSLEIVDLSWSRALIELPDLSKAPNLRYVVLRGCRNLIRVPLWPKHDMVEQDSTECKEHKKISLESQVSLTSLGTEESEEDDNLDLCGTSLPLWPKHNMVEQDSTECEEHKKISLGSQVSLTSLGTEESEEDDNLDLCGTSLPLWPKHNMVEQDSTECEEHKKISLGSQISLTSLGTEESEEDDYLDLCGTSLQIKPSVKYYELPSLQVLVVTLCGNIIEIPDNIGLYLPSLQKWNLRGTHVETLPASIKHLSQLKILLVDGCSRLRYIPELPPSIEKFHADGCRSLETFEFTSNSMPLSHQQYQLFIALRDCVKLDDHKLEAVARYFKLTIQRMISASIEDSYAELYITRTKVPECLSSNRVAQDPVSVPLKLPLHSKAMGFIFYYVFLEDFGGFPKIKCHIELTNVSKVQFISGGPRWRHFSGSDHIFLWYEDSLSLKIMDEVSRIKASTTTDDLYARIWFELYDCPRVKEWGVYPIFYSEPKDLTKTKRSPDISDSDEDDYDNFDW